MRADLRNLLAIPRARGGHFLGSSVLDLASTSRLLQAVNESSIGTKAFPCCVKGGACCPSEHAMCCSHNSVHKWMQREFASGRGGASLLGSTRSSWYDSAKMRFRPHGEMVDLGEWDAQKSHTAPEGSHIRGVGFGYYREPSWQPWWQVRRPGRRRE